VGGIASEMRCRTFRTAYRSHISVFPLLTFEVDPSEFTHHSTAPHPPTAGSVSATAVSRRCPAPSATTSESPGYTAFVGQNVKPTCNFLLWHQEGSSFSFCSDLSWPYTQKIAFASGRHLTDETQILYHADWRPIHT